VARAVKVEVVNRSVAYVYTGQSAPSAYFMLGSVESFENQLAEVQVSDVSPADILVLFGPTRLSF